jgi:transposase-like protein
VVRGRQEFEWDLVEQVSNPPSTLSSLFKVLDSKDQWPVRPSPPSNCKAEALNYQAQKWLTPEEIVGLVEAYPGGSTIKDLAATYGIHRWTVLEHLKRQGVPRRRSKLSQVDIDKAIDLYRLGHSMQSIAETIGSNSETVRQRLIKSGVELRARRGWTQNTN